jgi:POTRA domain-containing FtsQ-type protein
LVTGARILGVLLIVASILAADWMLTSATFRLDQAQVSGDLRYTDAQTVLSAAGIGANDHPNVTRVRSDAIALALTSFPAIADAQVNIELPNTVVVNLKERVAIFALRRAPSVYLVDADGLVLGTADDTVAANLGVPIIDDERTQSAPPLAVGVQLDPIELAAIVQLGAVTPALVDSQATSLELAERDDDGFVMTAQPTSWQAIFGNYTPNLRPTDIIARQVQCLRSLLGSAEPDVTTVYLAPLDDSCGTYRSNATPSAPTPAPTKSR